MYWLTSQSNTPTTMSAIKTEMRDMADLSPGGLRAVVAEYWDIGYSQQLSCHRLGRGHVGPIAMTSIPANRGLPCRRLRRPQAFLPGRKRRVVHPSPSC
jgi:hypothetical protein